MAPCAVLQEECMSSMKGSSHAVLKATSNFNYKGDASISPALLNHHQEKQYKDTSPFVTQVIVICRWLRLSLLSGRTSQKAETQSDTPTRKTMRAFVKRVKTNRIKNPNKTWIMQKTWLKLLFRKHIEKVQRRVLVYFTEVCRPRVSNAANLHLKPLGRKYKNINIEMFKLVITWMISLIKKSMWTQLDWRDCRRPASEFKQVLLY